MIRKSLKTLSALFVVFCVALTPTLVYAEPATSRVSTFIELGKQKSLVDAKAENLTPEEVRFLGVYASNFYTPFLSTLGEPKSLDEGDEDDGKKSSSKDSSVMKAMDKALQENLNFAPDSAKLMSRFIIGNVMKGGVELKLGASNDSKGKNATSVNSAITPSWMRILSLLGGVDSDFRKKWFGNKRYGVLFYSKDGVNIPAFTWDLTGQSVTPSVASLLIAFNISSPNDGKGVAVFDLVPDDENLADRLKSSVKNLLESKGFEYSMYNSRMYLSPFGDLTIKAKFHTWVAIPAALNASTWETPGGTPGDVFVHANYQNMVSTNAGQPTWSSPTTFRTHAAFDNSIRYKSKSDIGLGGTSGRSTYYTVPLNMGAAKGGSDDNNKWFFQSSDYSKIFENIATQLKNTPDTWVAMDTGYGLVYQRVLFRTEIVGDSGVNTPMTYPLGSGVDKVNVANKMVLLDTLDAFQGDAPEDAMYQPVIEGSKVAVASVGNFDGVSWKDAVSDSSLTAAATEMPKAVSVSLYTTYMLAAFGDKNIKDKLGFELNPSLPPLVSASLELEDDSDIDPRADAILTYAYLFLNPSWEHVEYAAQLLTSTVSGLLVRWHNDMTGSQSVNVVSGTTKYVGFAGYVSTPTFHDLPWTDSLAKLWKEYSIFIIIFVGVVLLCLTLLKVISLGRLLLSLLVFVFVATAIIPATNASITVSNLFSDYTFSQKFTYWALATHQSYSTKIDEAATGDSYANYLRTLYNNSPHRGTTSIGGEDSINSINNKGTDNILLKWQRPKSRTAVSISKDLNETLSSSPSLRKLFNGAVAANLTGESYVDDPYSQYLYRSYIDVANQSRYLYKGLSDRYGDKTQAVGSPNYGDWTDKDLVKAFQKMSETISADQKMGYSNLSMRGSSSAADYTGLKTPFASNIVSSHFKDKDKISKLRLNTYVGIPQGAFAFPLKPYTKGTSFREEITAQQANGFNPNQYKDADYASLGAYALMTESPYYWFSWYLYDQGLNPNEGAEGSLKDLILAQPHQGFFYNSVDSEGKSTQKQTGELKDFLGLKPLFTYVIPYLKMGNEVVKEYERQYGLKIYPALPLEPGHENDPDIKDNPTLRQQYWQNVNVAQLGNMYTPWVDLMYDASYAKPEYISVKGESVLISDPLNPASYPSKRPMVFSPAEAQNWGLTYADLTSAEKLIFDFLEKSKTSLVSMLNYFNFKDNVTNSGSSMLVTFDFNRQFSEPSWFGEGVNLYPQSYELKNFSYDAYLRLIMANSLDKDILKTKGSFYLTVIQESSVVTAIFLVITDVLSIYIYPLLKYLSLICLVIVSILLVTANIFRAYEDSIFKRALNSIFKPYIKLSLYMLLFTFILSLFMGEPANAVTGELGFSLKFNDPVMTLFALASLTALFCYIYFRILRGLYADIKLYGGAVVSSATGALGGAMSLMKRGIARRFNRPRVKVQNRAPSVSVNLAGADKTVEKVEVIKTVPPKKETAETPNKKVKEMAAKLREKNKKSSATNINSVIKRGFRNIKRRR